MSFEIKNLSGGYGNGDVCKEISCKVDYNEILCVLGPNGCGKSTLFKLILGLIKKSNGNITLDGETLCGISERELAKKIAYIPQQHNPLFAFSVLEIVLMGRTSHFKSFSMPCKNDIEEAKNALEKLGILNLANKNYTLLSGGQRQLVLIARAICQQAKILVMDEPTANLDYANAQKVMSVIRAIAKDGYIVILSTHSPEQPFSCGSKVLLMNKGKIHDFGNPLNVLTTENLYDVYGIEMDIVQVKDRTGVTRTLCLPINEVVGC